MGSALRTPLFFAFASFVYESRAGAAPGDARMRPFMDFS